jgi:hypothetical protein
VPLTKEREEGKKSGRHGVRVGVRRRQKAEANNGCVGGSGGGGHLEEAEVSEVRRRGKKAPSNSKDVVVDAVVFPSMAEWRPPVSYECY